jgi:hypothetical protein
LVPLPRVVWTAQDFKQPQMIALFSRFRIFNILRCYKLIMNKLNYEGGFGDIIERRLALFVNLGSVGWVVLEETV